MGRIEEVQTDHASRISSTDAISVMGRADVFVANTVSGLHIAFEFLPYILLDIHILEHGFDHQVYVLTILQRRVVFSRFSDHRIQGVLGHFFLFNRVLECLPYRGHPFVQGFLIDVPEDNVISAAEQKIDNPRSHDSAAEHSHFLDFGRLNPLYARQPSGGSCIQENADQIFRDV